MPGAHVEIKALHKSFDFEGRRIDVLRGVSLTVAAGDMVAVVGASGAGKSTFLHVLGTLDAPSQGQMLIDGVEVTSMSAAALAAFRNRTIGFVFQFHHLLPEFTALENASMPGLIAGLPRAEATKRATELLKRVHLGHRLQHRPGELSGGEQQRVALARALLMEPRLLLADEPTGNLDARTGADIHQLVFDLNRERGMTMIVVTHNEDLAMRMPRRLQMHEGVIIDTTQEPSHPASTPAQCAE
ncbi:MAG TPA: ABC transporter ATP-binding protein [Pseudomonadota bacterium]|jgi:lipoprotein-releasing system ATP-binding protein|nr:ABC transporter ATP-binding protein [Deltaproteobacteria bacterium]HPH29008.1 ABC transporter ATP-binding protein [Pseudomonadota bacterium]